MIKMISLTRITAFAGLLAGITASPLRAAPADPAGPDRPAAQEQLPPESLIPEPQAEPLARQQLGAANSQASKAALQKDAGWRPLDAQQMSELLRQTLGTVGIAPQQTAQSSERFLADVRDNDSEPLTAWVRAVASQIQAVQELLPRADKSLLELATRLDPSGPDYASIESMPAEMRAALRTWIGRELVRARYYDEALQR